MSRTDDELVELLDAYLDGELDVDERADVDAWLARSPVAHAELDAIDRVRRLVRGLPVVEPPPDFLESVSPSPPAHEPRRTAARARARDRHRHRVPGLTAAVAGIVTALALIAVGLTATTEQVVPDLDGFERRHEAMLASSAEPIDDEFEPMPDDELDSIADPYAAPRELPMGYERMAGYHAPDVWHVVYSNGTEMISVFQQPGYVEWAAMPDEGEQMMMDDDKAWQSQIDGDVVVVLERDGLVVTVVATAPSDHTMMAASMIPDPAQPGFDDRVVDTCERLAESFGFPG